MTPAERGTTHYYWGAAFDIADVSEDIANKTEASVIAAFDGDKHLLQIMQEQLMKDPRGTRATEITLGADGAGVRAPGSEQKTCRRRARLVKGDEQ